MSATFRLSAKKKVSQDDLRRLMAEHKGKNAKPSPKIDNPLAKYNDAGQLMCILCKSVVRSDSVWQVHVNAKQHRDNVAEAKRLKETTNNFTAPAKAKVFKRPGTPPPASGSAKKVKGILKNAVPTNLPSDFFQSDSKSVPNVVSQHNEEIIRAPIDTTITSVPKPQEPTATASKLNEGKDVNVPQAPIPEGFFDDPILDAKARNIEYKDPIEEEWEKFQKELREEATVSAEIIAGEQEEATSERQIDEIDEQMRNWSRVLDLEVKKEETKNKKLEQSDMAVDSGDEDMENDTDIDEFLDWRAKKSYR